MSREEMTNEEAIAIIRKEYLCVDRDCDIDRSCGKCDLMMPSKEPILEAYKLAIEALEQEPVVEPLERLAESASKTAKALERLEEQEHILDKIRAEIADIEEGISSYHNDRPWIFKDEVLQIIDKYRKE